MRINLGMGIITNILYIKMVNRFFCKVDIIVINMSINGRVSIISDAFYRTMINITFNKMNFT